MFGHFNSAGLPQTCLQRTHLTLEASEELSASQSQAAPQQPMGRATQECVTGP